MKKLLSVILIAVILSTLLPMAPVQAATKTAASYLADGNKYLGLSKYQDAIKAFDSAIKLNSKYTEAYVGKGRAQYGLGSYAEAVKSYDKAISLNKKYAPALYYKGLALLELDKMQECISAYNAAIALNPKYAEAYNAKGFALEFTGKYDDALVAYNTAIKLNSKLIDAYINKASILVTHFEKYNDANVVADAALKINTSNDRALYCKAVALQGLNNHIQAIAYFDKAIKLNTKAPKYYLGKGVSQYATKKYTDALTSFNKAIELYPKGLTGNAEYYYYRALAYRDLGKYDFASKDIKTVLEMDPYYVDNIAGMVADSKYISDYLGIELNLPSNWYMTSIDLKKLLEQYQLPGSVQMDDAYLPLMLSKYPIGSTADSNPNLMLMMQNVSAYPQIKTGADFIPSVIGYVSSLQKDFKYDSVPEKVTLGSVDFDVINCNSEPNGVKVYQKLYATIYRGYALCFVLTYTDSSELPQLENILKTIEFIK